MKPHWMPLPFLCDRAQWRRDELIGLSEFMLGRQRIACCVTDIARRLSDITRTHNDLEAADALVGLVERTLVACNSTEYSAVGSFGLDSIRNGLLEMMPQLDGGMTRHRPNTGSRHQ